MRLPAHTFVGAAILLLSEAGMLAHVEPFWMWHTPFAWTGYILLVDGIVYKLRGSSWLTTNRSEFVFLAIVSIPLWVVFEGYNLLIENWYYVNLPENLVVRYVGYARRSVSRRSTADCGRSTADCGRSTGDWRPTVD